MTIAAFSHPWLSVPKYSVTVDEYVSFRRNGFLIVRGLLLAEHVDELLRHTEALISGEFDVSPFVHIPTDRPFDRRDAIHRIHMGHEKIELWERYLLYPRVLDVVAALHGPDISAMQTMLFTKAPGSNGQGFHQDSYYIPTFPDSLIGAWIAIDRADEENGCLWMSTGSQAEPIYPPSHGYGYGNISLKDIHHVENVGGHSNSDEDPANTLKPIAENYGQVEIPAILNPGDVVFFGGRVFHRSLKNRSEDRYRRSFVNHYCNARSFTPWGGGNKNHILARGNTHLAFALPKFGTPCAALDPSRASVSDAGSINVPTMMMATMDGMMGSQTPSIDPHDD